MRYVPLGALILVLAATAEARLQSTMRFRALEPIELEVGDDAGSQAVAFADLNGDARPDMITIDRDNDQLVVLLGGGDGTFGEARFYELDDAPAAVAVVDLASPFASDAAGDIDGRLDIVVAQDDGEAFIFLGRGDGDFDLPEQDLSEVLDSVELIGVVVGDFDRNGRMDLALLDLFEEVYFLCNQQGNLAPCLNDVLDTLGEDPVAIAGGDFDDDTFRDVAVLNRGSRSLSPVFGNGDGSFEMIETVPAAAPGDQQPSLLAAGRLDDDESDDLVVGNHSTLADPVLLALYGDPGRDFTSDSFPAELFLTGLALGDLDADGALDAAMVVGQPVEADGIFISRGDGSGGFRDPFVPVGFSSTGRAVSIVDLDGDEKLDVVVLDPGGTAIQVGLNQTPGFCAGDCDQDERVSIDELVLAVGIALGSRAVAACEPADSDGSNRVAINELIAAVGRALEGCPI